MDKFLIGDSLRQRLKTTIEKVDSMPFGSPVTKIPTFLEGDFSSPLQPDAYRIATFTGSWSIGSDKEVRLVANTSSTVLATNLFFPISNVETEARIDCAVASEGTSWYLVSVPLETVTINIASPTTKAIVVTSTQSVSVVAGTETRTFLTGMNISAALNTNNCSIAITASPVTASATFLTGVKSAVVATGTREVNIATSSTTATALRIKL